MHELRKGRQVANCRLFLDDGTPFGVSLYACASDNSVSSARTEKKKKKKKKGGRGGGGALSANRKTKQVRKPRHTHEEITVLPEQVATNKVIIQSTLNSEVTNQQKGQLLQDIARKGSNCGVCVRTPDQVCEKLSDMKKDFFRGGKKTKKKRKKQKKTEKKKKEKNNKTTTTRNKQTKWGTGAVQDKPFDELLMFIVGKDSALFSGL